MAIAFDTVSGLQSATSNSITYSHTCTGSDRFLMVGVNTFDATTNVTGVTYNGVAMTAHPSNPQSSGASERIWVYYLANPASGANNVVVSLSASVFVLSEAISHTGAVGGFDSSGANAVTNTSITVSVTTIADNTWLVGWFRGVAAGNFTAGANTTLRSAPSDLMMADTNAAQTPPGSKSMTVSLGSSDTMAALAISISPTSGGTPAVNHWLLMGV